jgi:ubiquinone/menaquinone biosynthesis C-methylase UbiE
MAMSAGKPGWYERRVLPWLLDLACGIRPFWRQRQKVVPLARGRVLEVGIGTGLNLAHYDKARVDQVVGLDPGVEMHPLARRRANAAGITVQLVALSAERIPFEDGAFDTVLSTYTLCTIPDPVAALKEMRRVLKPAGRLIFCEHGLARDASVRAWQHRLTPAWSRVGGGCQLDRDIPGLLQQAGFRCLDLQTGYLPGPRPFGYNFWGVAEAV